VTTPSGETILKLLFVLLAVLGVVMLIRAWLTSGRRHSK
jgi:hypothetical protein